MIYADVNDQLCFQKLFYWLAYDIENGPLHCLNSYHYLVCITLTKKIAKDLVTSYPMRMHEDYGVAY